MNEHKGEPGGRRAQAVEASATEHEFKLALASGREAQLLRAALERSGSAPESELLQINHYFDDALGSLRSAGMALRLREAGGECWLTAKGRTVQVPAAASESALSSQRESEARVSTDEGANVVAGGCSPLELLASKVARTVGAALVDDLRAVLVGPLVRVGTFRNTRTRVGPLHLPGTMRDLRVVIELDRTEFPGDDVQHELELEVPAEHAAACGAALRKLFQSTGIAWRPSRSKAARLFEILAKG